MPVSNWTTYLSIIPVEILPDEVHAVDVSMMQVETRLQRGEVGITTGVAGDGVVTAAVDTHADVLLLDPGDDFSLHHSLEGLDVLADEDRICRLLERGAKLAHLRAEISLNAPRVVLERIRGAHGPDVDGEVGERSALLETATTGSSADGLAVPTDGIL